MILHAMDVVGSTSDEARRLAEAGAPHGTMVTARQQTAGRGRHGRSWASPPGNLHASAVLRTGLPTRRMPELGFVAALAVADMADHLLNRPATALKWPNDVMLGGAKLAGILLEALDGGAAILGVGMNLAHVPVNAPYPVTALSQHGAAATPEDAAACLVETLEARLADWRRAGFGATRAAWLQRGPAPGSTIRIRLGGQVTQAAFAGLDTDGALLLSTGAQTRRVVAGELLAQ